MDYHIETDDNAKIVLCTASGTLNIQNAEKISLATNPKAYALNYSVIYDLSQTHLAATIVDAYEFPRNRAALFGAQNEMPKKIAIVYAPGKNIDFWRFYETTATNAGLILKVFDSVTKAREWCTA